MNIVQSDALRYFARDEHYLNGVKVEWWAMNLDTMRSLDALRHKLGRPCRLIWNQKHFNTDKVDFCFPGVPMGRVYMQLQRMQGASWGLYSGRSYHLDSRPFTDLPARWAGIRPYEFTIFREAGLDEAFASAASDNPEWIYLKWDHPLAWEAIRMIVHLADSVYADGEVG